MNSHYAKGYWERSCATSSGLNTINRKMLKAMPLFVPQVAEQNQIAASVALAKAQIHQLNRSLLKLQVQKLGLMHDLLTGKVEIEVPTPEPEFA